MTSAAKTATVVQMDARAAPAFEVACARVRNEEADENKKPLIESAGCREKLGYIALKIGRCQTVCVCNRFNIVPRIFWQPGSSTSPGGCRFGAACLGDGYSCRQLRG
jgi:hypothetical protein